MGFPFLKKRKLESERKFGRNLGSNAVVAGYRRTVSPNYLWLCACVPFVWGGNFGQDVDFLVN